MEVVMLTIRTLLRIVLAALLAAATSACDGTIATTRPKLPEVRASYQQLGTLTIAAPQPMTGYSRARFPHWTERNGCSTRELILERDGQDALLGPNCVVTSGRWRSPYDQVTITDPTAVDVDHVVPLANAWRSGANRWSATKREAFANDLDHLELLAVSRASNRAKGDQAPDQWRPPNRSFWCTYARAWIDVKSDWTLSATRTERRTLEQMLSTCPSGGSQ
jgi:hypothetical protein